MNIDKNQHLQILHDKFGISANNSQFIVALAGNPNVGKSTVFNSLTGLRQHTGNWPGKTVDNAQGSFNYGGHPFLLIDLPGTYSILAHTPEEAVARDFICFGNPHATLVVLDATCLERNLNLALQVMEITPNIVVCLNMIDEARKKRISIDVSALQLELGVPVIPAAARTGEGLDDLCRALYQVAAKSYNSVPRQVTYSTEVEQAIAYLLPKLKALNINGLNPRWLALRLLDGDETFIASLQHHLNMPYTSSTCKEAVI